MIADWKPYPKIRPPKSGSYMVTYKSGGINFRYYNKIGENSGDFTRYHTEVIAWDFKPEGYKEQDNDGKNNQTDR